MIPGDLVKFKEGKGFSWWGDHIYIYLETDQLYSSWCKVLQDTGEIIDAEIQSLEVINDSR
jgi:hypothetical protein